jgi:predicted ATPase/DNA-binding winged helix-turn-helix (wHTH) protein
MQDVTPRGSPRVIGSVWRLRLLGGFSLQSDHQTLDRLRSRAATVLLAKLALSPQRDVPREGLADMLWPDAEAEVGRSRLRQTLSLLRAVLEPPGGPPVLHADRRSLRLVTEAVWCDAVEFEQSARRADHTRAHSLYRGELLPGFYDEWVLEERARLEFMAERLDSKRESRAAVQPGADAQAANQNTAVPSPIFSMAGPSARLPSYLTRWLGTQDSQERLQAHVIENRWVSVLGAGGCGKTRLTVEVARQFAQSQEGVGSPRFERVFFASLVDCFNAAQTLDRLKLAVRLESAGDPVEQLVDALDGQPVLVVLDNCEQLEDDAVARLAWLSEQLPNAHWLASSRRPLGLNGEHEFVLNPLPLPSSESALDEVVRNPAVALLVDRSRAHRPDFHVSTANRDSVVALVCWLDGLPLAIELAASRSRSLTPAHMLTLLEEARQDLSAPAASLAWLSRRGNRSGSDARHASMLVVIEWSWKLLTPPLQRLLDVVCVLQAGASLEAACALLRLLRVNETAQAAPSLASTHALLDELVAHSMLQAQAGADGQLRYQASEPVREYAASLRSDENARALRHHVLAWLLSWARGMPATPPLATVRTELPNVLTALARAGDDGNAGDALRLVLALQSSWSEIAIPTGLLKTLSQLADMPGLDPSLVAGAHAIAASSCFEAGFRDDALRHALAALPNFAGRDAPEPAACAAAIPDPEIRAMVLSRVARIRYRIERKPEAFRALLAQGLAHARALERRNTEGAILSLQAHLAATIDRDDELSVALSRQALALWEQSGNLHLIHAGRFNVSVNLLQAKQYAQAIAGFLPLVEAGRAQQDWDLLTGSLDACGTSLMALQRYDEAEAHLRQSLQVAWETMQMQSVAFALWNISPVLARLRHATLAAQTMGFAEVFWKQRFGEFDASDRRDLRRVRRFVRCMLGPEKAQTAWAEGGQHNLAAAVRAVLERP